ncbi:MAG: VCBS repeat-containing protein [Actinobacteria bacterium]|nr:VCBS repeat-containing protein [Actinomycetota bacterium]MBV9255759.1 VCBS repeat-containing protein [Actinomycetota bacterium]
MTRTPSGGPDGTRINLNGTCDADNQVHASLYYVGSDYLVPYGTGDYTVGPGGTWRGTLDVTTHGNNGPSDLDLSVTCGELHTYAPFALTDRVTSSTPSILTIPAGNGCGPAFAPPPPREISCRAHVKGFANSVLTQTNFYADQEYGGGSVAVGNVDGSGQAEIVVGSGPGHDPRVWVFSLSGSLISSFVPYDPSFKGGVNVAVGDLDGDRKAEIITGARSGGGPHVRIFDGSGNPIGSGFFAYDPAFHGGVNVAVGDVNGDGKADIITGAGPGGGPHVRVFNASGTPVGGGFFAYDPRFVGGVSVAAATNRIVTGAGPGGGPHVRLFDGAGNPSSGGFFAYDAGFVGGVRVAVGPNGIVTGPGAGGGPDVRAFSFAGSMTEEFFAYGGNVTAGVNVAALGPGGGSSSASGPGGSTTSNPGGITITNPNPGSVSSTPGGSTTSG